MAQPMERPMWLIAAQNVYVYVTSDSVTYLNMPTAFGDRILSVIS